MRHKASLRELQQCKLGLVLSGGGVRGMAHIGVIKAMEEFGLEAQVVAGSSAGALVGALYAKGHSVDHMLRFFRETPLFKYTYFALGKPGLINTERFSADFGAHFPENDFKALQRELFVVATNLEQGREEVIDHGELILPLLASAALPPVFSPVNYRGNLYADGGIMNNFPLEPVVDKVDCVLGSNVSIVVPAEKKHLANSLQLTGRTTNLMIYAINKAKLKECHVLIEPKALAHIGILDRKGIEKAYAIGYEAAVQEFNKLR
ncbi:patatin-like phospholipase family protein [Maribacter sp. 2307ULW6-5]|uniref:patatin-like phospholipase family protein n=1 Tax=Maribacter sp. 2307ULW6-5 TaxID=3386275 RepID=UPI0039BCDD82